MARHLPLIPRIQAPRHPSNQYSNTTLPSRAAASRPAAPPPSGSVPVGERLWATPTVRATSFACQLGRRHAMRPTINTLLECRLFDGSISNLDALHLLSITRLAAQAGSQVRPVSHIAARDIAALHHASPGPPSRQRRQETAAPLVGLVGWYSEQYPSVQGALKRVETSARQAHLVRGCGDRQLGRWCLGSWLEWAGAEERLSYACYVRASHGRASAWIVLDHPWCEGSMRDPAGRGRFGQAPKGELGVPVDPLLPAETRHCASISEHVARLP